MLDVILKYKYELISFGVAIYFLTTLRRRKRIMKVVEKLENRLDGQTVLITGANTGIGFETAVELAKRGARVIVACRDETKANRAVRTIKKLSKNEHVFFELLDLASFDSVRECANKINSTYSRVDIIVNNAGVMACPKWTTQNGFDYQLQVNYLSHYLLTRILLDKISHQSGDQSDSSRTRIINVVSKLYESGRINWEDINLERTYDPIDAYKQSKLCNILFTNQLQKQLRGNGSINVYSVSPGIVLTELGRHTFRKNILMSILSFLFYPLLWALLKSPQQGCECVVYCAIVSELKPSEGKYFRDCREIDLLDHAKNEIEEDRLWKISEDFVRPWLN